jgi:hypothetical protein
MTNAGRMEFLRSTGIRLAGSAVRAVLANLTGA